MGIAALFFAGCKKEAEPQPEAQRPASYMNDPEFRSQLDTQRVAHVKLVRERNSFADRLKEKFDEARRRLKTDDPAKVKAELEKDPEWKELYAKCTNAAARVEVNRQNTLGIVRERLTRQKEISK